MTPADNDRPSRPLRRESAYRLRPPLRRRHPQLAGQPERTVGRHGRGLQAQLTRVGDGSGSRRRACSTAQAKRPSVPAATCAACTRRIRDCGTERECLRRQFFSREYRLDYLIHTYPKPLLCWGHGIVMGGGMGLMAGASHRVVTERTRMAMPEIGIGLFPDVGGSWFLHRLPVRTGLFLALTGAPLNAADALFAGLADFCLPHASRERGGGGNGPGRMASATRRRSAACSATCSWRRRSRRRRRPIQPARPLRCDPALIGTDGLADIATRLEQAAGDDSWLGAAAARFLQGSPTSAALAHELLQRARHLSLRRGVPDGVRRRLGFCAHHDFAEGIRALLVDKDRKPRWQPARLAEVDAALIEEPLQAAPGPESARGPALEPASSSAPGYRRRSRRLTWETSHEQHRHHRRGRPEGRLHRTRQHGRPDGREPGQGRVPVARLRPLPHRLRPGRGRRHRHRIVRRRLGGRGRRGHQHAAGKPACGSPLPGQRRRAGPAAGHPPEQPGHRLQHHRRRQARARWPRPQPPSGFAMLDAPVSGGTAGAARRR